MKKIKWVGETRMIPNYGMGEKGKTKKLPDNMADSFIAQGLAEVLKTPTKKATKENT